MRVAVLGGVRADKQNPKGRTLAPATATSASHIQRSLRQSQKQLQWPCKNTVIFYDRVAS